MKIETSRGTVEQLSREIYFTSNSATALLYNVETNQVILTRQLRIPTLLNNNQTGMMLETCAGVVEKNEDPQREIII